MICQCLTNRIPDVTAERILLITAVLTAIFAALQMVGAICSHSLSLLGDSGDMAIDALTYALAYIVERKRSRCGKLSWRLQLLENFVIMLE